MRLWLKTPLAVLADGAEGGIVVEDGRIAELLPRGAAPASPVNETFDASRHVVLPGLVNAHHHFYQTLVRAHPVGLKLDLLPWLVALYPIWSRMDERDLRLATRVALVELLLSGCTTSADHHNLFPPGLENAIDVEVEETRALGVRATITRGAMSFSAQATAAFRRTMWCRTTTIVLADCERVALKRSTIPRWGAMTQIAFAPCSPYAVHKPLMPATRGNWLTKHRRSPAHPSDARSRTRSVSRSKRTDCGRWTFLASVGWLGPRALARSRRAFQRRTTIARLGRSAGVGVCHLAAADMLAGGRHLPNKGFRGRRFDR